MKKGVVADRVNPFEKSTEAKTVFSVFFCFFVLKAVPDKSGESLTRSKH